MFRAAVIKLEITENTLIFCQQIEIISIPLSICVCIWMCIYVSTHTHFIDSKIVILFL